MRLRNRWKADWLWLAALLLLVSLHFWFPPVGRGLVHDTYSTSAAGKKAFLLLCEERGLYAERVRDSLDDFSLYWDYGEPGATVLCLLGPARDPTAAERDGLLEWVRAGGTLLYAVNDERVGDRFPFDSLGIEVKPLDESAAALFRPSASVADENVTSPLVSAGELRWKSSARLVAPRGETLVESRGTVQAVRQSFGRGTVVVVASDFIFSNQSLAWGDNSVLVFRLLESTGNPVDVYFDESLNATGTPKVVGLLLDPFLRPVTVQLLIGLLLFGWWQSRRFGPMLPSAAQSHRNIVDHTDTVGGLYYRARDGAAVLRAYLQQLTIELRLNSHRGREERVLEPIALRLGQTTAQVQEVIHKAHQAAALVRLDRRTAAELIRQLAVIRRAGLER